MYTTQVTQKPKKFSNGILKLAKLGSHQMQVSCILLGHIV